MSEPLDELYFVWLYRQVGDIRVTNPSHSYWRMLKLLYDKEFVWFIPNDDNRLEDGKDLRCEFVDQERLIDVDPSWMRLGCSMLELLIALSRRLAFEAEGEPRGWFWRLIRNLSLHNCNDANLNYMTADEIDEILDRVIWRTYQYNGHGGLFPLERPHEDQRHVELWYQLSAYVLEMV